MSGQDDRRPAAAQGWEPELAALHLRARLAQALGGADKVARQHAGGRLTVRERIAALADPDTRFSPKADTPKS